MIKLPDYFKGSELADIGAKVVSGERLNYEDGLRLFRSQDINFMGYLANQVRQEMHGKKVYYSSYLNLNPTNICEVACLFCSFARLPNEEGGYSMNLAQVKEKVALAVEKNNIREVHIVGGLNDALPVQYYYDVVAAVKEVKRDLFVKAYTAVEIDYFAERSGKTYTEVLQALMDHGLDMLPGGGAEIFAERIRRKICIKKMDQYAWLDVHRAAHKLGLASNCTMLYGHVENEEDRVDHMLKLRDLQDETNGFNCFIPLAYQDENNPLSKLVKEKETDGMTDLKVYAISRLLLDNIPHIKGYWTTIGLRFAQVALSYGVDDLSGTAFDEKIMHDAGTATPVSVQRNDLDYIIKQAGFEPCEIVSSYAQIFNKVS